MRPTRPLVLVVTAVVAGLVGWLVAGAAYAALSPLPLLVGATPLLLGLAEGATALLLRARLRGAPGTRPVHPIDVARIAALAKASSLVGAVVAGGYAGVAVQALARREGLDAAAGDSVAALLGAAAGAVLAAAALALERVCRVPTDRRRP